ncbi:transcriptional regulator [Bacillus thuringiensis]|uniref:PTS sugar transporter subunit IIC n=1 Tax=Bacillus cereus group TaxID=86661 RepID=UPI000BEC4E3A|nr:MULTISPECIES: PTS sugar transporter subunit IIC [Bacillus cereus group]PEA49845.1 transcriptional regulator [Bacillus thuringiensis]PES87632.1 transcriptional regulator [Bacillus thuringiensis]PEZ78758.1 transcriptional regulator [Bacillus thuringiensis]PFE12898.1 transcriptional regulator [Bacillus thuringiensis]PFT61428.1 transcriptional regulator [Bacillus thuringiensis]
MEMLKGTLLLLTVLSCMSLFCYKAPHGMKAMGGLSGAACATFLVEAFHSYVTGDLIGIPFLKDLGQMAGGLGGIAAGTLVCLKLGVNPVYSMMVGVAVADFKLLPAFIAGYLVSFLIKQIEKRIPEGFDLIVTVIVVPVIARLIATTIAPVVVGLLQNIGDVLISAGTGSPILLGIILGGIIPLVGMSPLSSMALTSLIGLTGMPMAIGALSVTNSSFVNYMLFKRMKFGNKASTTAVAIEPLTQFDIIASNPIPIYLTNAMGGMIAGIVVASFGLINNAVGTATPIAGLVVMFGFNDPMKVLLCTATIMTTGLLSGFIGSLVFKNFKIRKVEDIRETPREISA